MAIEFIDQPDSASFVPYGNNIIFEFIETTDSDFATVQLNNYNLRLFPNSVGKYYVNLKNIARNNTEGNVNLLDLPIGNQYTLYSDSVIIRTYKNNSEVSYIEKDDYVFSPQSIDFDVLYNPPAITHRYAFMPLKVVRFGDLPLYYYSFNADLTMLEKTTFAPPAVEIVFRDKTCGKYIKFLNKQGGYNYWLFSEANENINASSLGTLYNDFTSFGFNESPYMEVGKNSFKSFSCTSGILEDWENDIVKDIFSSPKVFLHLGYDSWLEVNVTNTSARISNAKGNNVEYILNVELPPNNNLTL